MNNYVHRTTYTQLFIAALAKILSRGVISLLYSCYFFFPYVEWIIWLDNLGFGKESTSSFHSPPKAYSGAPHSPAVAIQGRLLQSILVGRGKWVCHTMNGTWVAHHVSKSMCLLFSKQGSSHRPWWITTVIFKTHLPFIWHISQFFRMLIKSKVLFVWGYLGLQYIK